MAPVWRDLRQRPHDKGALVGARMGQSWRLCAITAERDKVKIKGARSIAGRPVTAEPRFEAM